MQRAHRILGLASSLALALSLELAPASAEPVPSRASEVAESESLAERAFDAYARKDYAGSIGLYQQALVASPSADILYNLARVSDIGLRDRAQAISYYSRYVDDPGAVAGRIELAHRRLADLRAAEAAASTAAQPAPAPFATSGEPGVGAAALVAGVLGLVGVGIGVGFGLAATSEHEEADRSCDGNPCTSQRGADATRAAESEADVPTFGLAVGGVLLALGTVLWLLADADPEQPTGVSAVGVEPRLEPGALSVALSGGLGP